MKISIYKIADKWIGTPLCLVFGGVAKISQLASLAVKFAPLTLRKLFPKPKAHSPKRIAVLKLWAIGDSVVSLPMIRSLRRSFPEAKIDVVARKRNAVVFENSSDIDKIVLFEWSNLANVLGLFKKYDLVIDAEPWMRLSALLALFAGKRRVGFGGQARSMAYTDTVPCKKSQHMALNYIEMAKAAGAKKIIPAPVELKASNIDEQIVEEFLKARGLSGKKLVGICPGGADAASTRLWPAERFAELADKLIEKHKSTVIFVGGPSDIMTIDKIQSLMKNKSKSTSAIGKLSIGQLFYLAKKFRLFVSNDTGPMHIAANQGAPTIGLFGPSLPSLWGPYGKKTTVIYNKLPCSPCNIDGKTPDCLRKTEKGLCMKLISVKDALNAASKAF